MNTNFDTIQKIYETDITNVSAYLQACDSFEKDASAFCTNENIICRKAAEEVSLAYDRAKNTTEPYNVYVAALAAEMWLCKAWNNAD